MFKYDRLSIINNPIKKWVAEGNVILTNDNGDKVIEGNNGVDSEKHLIIIKSSNRVRFTVEE